ncbi:hypothetical protein AG1IA_08100 [Rhizoctonia solani AG-1 IA]|uniref:Uncharacterized protein n=1 Tax=Thanatephorus cucumeris (strain AG1-IA) TaxID=983506 RepID=L8WIY2_THACA|nr:hypothetical protein AG1IA_08100 [Rhizoctonia solani AG-1 IA]
MNGRSDQEKACLLEAVASTMLELQLFRPNVLHL